MYNNDVRLPGKSLEWGLRKEGVLKAVRELDGNERESCEALLRDVSMYARGKESPVQLQAKRLLNLLNHLNCLFFVLHLLQVDFIFGKEQQLSDYFLKRNTNIEAEEMKIYNTHSICEFVTRVVCYLM